MPSSVFIWLFLGQLTSGKGVDQINTSNIFHRFRKHYIHGSADGVTEQNNENDVISLKPEYMTNFIILEKLKHILIWKYGAGQFYMRKFLNGRTVFIDGNCKYTNCYITHDHKYLDSVSDYDAVVFDQGVNRIPLHRSPRQKYIFVQSEPSGLYPKKSKDFDRFFNWTMGFRLDSDIKTPYVAVYDRFSNATVGPDENMQWLQHMNPITRRVRNIISTKHKLVAIFIKNYVTNKPWEPLLLELNEKLYKFGFEVNVFETCSDLSCSEAEMEPYLKMLRRDYYFYLAFENAFNKDYVSEEVLYALNYYTVPVVYGGASYRRFLPPGSYINACAYDPYELAVLLVEIMNNNKRYYRFFRHTNHYTFRGDEHGMCTLCAYLNNKKAMEYSSVENFSMWYKNYRNYCNSPSDKLNFTHDTSGIDYMKVGEKGLDKEELDKILATQKVTLIKKKKLLKDKPAKKKKRIAPYRHILIWQNSTDKFLRKLRDGTDDFTDKNCFFSNCFITRNQTYLNSTKYFDAIIFDSGLTHFPGDRSHQQKYIFVNTKPSNLYPINKNTNEIFNMTMTYRIDSDIPIPQLNFYDNDGYWIGPRKNINWYYDDEMGPVTDNVKHHIQNKTKFAAIFTPNCNESSIKNKMLNMLNNSLHQYNKSIDVYGRCGNTSCSPRHTSCLEMFRRDYFFYLAFENSFTRDYVSHEVLYAINYYMVPIVFGGADYTRFLPPGSYINACSFTPHQLASAMVRISENRTEYYNHFRYRNIYNYYNENNAMCTLCEMLNKNASTDYTRYTNFSDWYNNATPTCNPHWYLTYFLKYGSNTPLLNSELFVQTPEYETAVNVSGEVMYVNVL